MKTVTGLFDAYDQAEDAVMALKMTGISSDDISILSRENARLEAPPAGVAESAGMGSGLGLIAGGAGGLLAGLGLVAIPGIGPAVAAGWLASLVAGAAAGTVFGGAAGGLIGALTGSDIPEDDAHVYAEAVRRGGTLLTIRIHDERERDVLDILNDHGAVNPVHRKHVYAEEGWRGFDPDLTIAPVPSARSDRRDYRARTARP
jgi:hypothetical protein